MTAKTSVAPSVMWVAAEGGASTILSVISLFIMAYVVGPTSVGVFALAFGIVDTVNLIVEFMFQDALIQRQELTRKHEDTAFTTAILLGLLSFTGLTLASGPLAALFGLPELQPVLIVTASTLLVTGLLSVPTAQLRRGMQFRVLAIRTIASRVAGAILGPTLALLGFGVWCFVAQHLSAVVISAILILNSVPRLPRLGFSWAHCRELVRFGAPLVATGMAGVAQSRLFPVLVGLFQGAAAVGFVNMAFRTAETAREMLAMAIHSIGMAVYSRQQNDLPSLNQSLRESSQMLCLVAQPIFGGIVAVAGDFVPAVLGSAWLPIVPLIQMLAAATMLRLLVFQSDVIATALGRPILTTLVSSFSLAVVVGGMLLVHPVSVVGAIAIWIVPQLCAIPFWLVAIGGLTRLSPWAQLRPGLRPLLCTVAMIALLVALDATAFAGLSDGVGLAAKIAGGFAIYLGLTLLFNRASLLGLIALVRSVLLKPADTQLQAQAQVPEST